jgi:hypothetical protein
LAKTDPLQEHHPEGIKVSPLETSYNQITCYKIIRRNPTMPTLLTPSDILMASAIRSLCMAASDVKNGASSIHMGGFTWSIAAYTAAQAILTDPVVVEKLAKIHNDNPNEASWIPHNG